MLLFFFMIGVFLSVIFLSFNAKKNTSTLYLGSFFLLISLYVFCKYVLFYSKSVSLVTVVLFFFPSLFPLFYLTGPMLYWYVRSVLNDNPELKKRDFFHLLPMVIFFIAAFPFAQLSLPEKVGIALQIVNNIGFMQTYASTFLSELFSVLAIFLSRPLLIFFYTVWSIAMFARYFMQKKMHKVFSGQYFMVKWLCLLLGFTFVLASSHMVFLYHIFKMNFSELALSLDVIQLLSAAGLIGLMISPFFFPGILYGLPQLPETNKQVGKKSNSMNAAKTFKASKHFEIEYLQSIDQQITAYMRKHQTYLQPHFNISHLAVEIEVPVHHLTYFFREEKNQSFTDYRNKWRIEHAKSLILNGESNKLTLEAIAILSGFTNRNSFCSVFQKSEGISPSAFASQKKKLHQNHTYSERDSANREKSV